jgi:anti-sigma28 factor (negative regulator of flagellin synthesis)
MAIAEIALAGVPDTRDEFVTELKKRIEEGDYKIDGKEVADMMMRRLEADRIR